MTSQLVSIPFIQESTSVHHMRKNRKNTHKSFQNTLSNPSSPRSSSVTPPNMTPVPLADQSAIVHPARAVGVCVDDAVLRFSHFSVRGVGRDGSRVILHPLSVYPRICQCVDRDALEEPGVIEDDADGTFPFGIFLTVATCRIECESMLDHMFMLEEERMIERTDRVEQCRLVWAKRRSRCED